MKSGGCGRQRRVEPPSGCGNRRRNRHRVGNAVQQIVKNRVTPCLYCGTDPGPVPCADRVAVLAGGELLQIGPPAEVITKETLRTCYAVEVAVLPIANDRYRVCVPQSYFC